VIRVLVAEDMRILRDTLAAVLSMEDDIDVVAQVADGDAIIPAALALRPDVALVDIDLPGTDGLTAASALRERCPGCRVLILTVLGQPGNLRRALAAGVAGFLPKETPSAELIAAVALSSRASSAAGQSWRAAGRHTAETGARTATHSSPPGATCLVSSVIADRLSGQVHQHTQAQHDVIPVGSDR
jgi:DNA-binding NarL/FixJ family response regulator